jgi:hypothetical protein
MKAAADHVHPIEWQNRVHPLGIRQYDAAGGQGDEAAYVDCTATEEAMKGGS